MVCNSVFNYRDIKTRKKQNEFWRLSETRFFTRETMDSRSRDIEKSVENLNNASVDIVRNSFF